MRCWSSVFISFFFFKQKTAYEIRISDWSSDVCSSDLYRPNIAFGGSKPMKCEFFTEQEGGHKPGTVGEIGMTCPVTISVGQAFTAYERKRLIGRGVILPPLDGQ